MIVSPLPFFVRTEMPIVTCPNGHKLNANEKHAGKSLACPKCKAVVSIPALPRAAAQPVLAKTSNSVVCPNGHKIVNVSQKLAGKTVACPKCKAPIVIPATGFDNPTTASPKPKDAHPTGSPKRVETVSAEPASDFVPSNAAASQSPEVDPLFADPFATPAASGDPFSADPLSGNIDLSSPGGLDFLDLSSTAAAMPTSPLANSTTAVARPTAADHSRSGQGNPAVPGTTVPRQAVIKTLSACFAGCSLGLVIVLLFAVWLF